MLVVIDSNVLTADFELQGVDSTTLLTSLLLTNEHRIAVPAVVLAEVVKNYERRLEKSVAGIRKAIHASRGAFPEARVSLPDDEEIQNLTNAYKNRLLQRLSEFEAEILDYPSVDHSEIVERILAHKRPFVKDDEGYRDFIVWKTVIKSFEQYYAWDGVAFISNDQGAFGTPNETPPQLHPDLTEELCVNSLVDEFTWYRTLQEFNEDNLEVIGLSIYDFMSSFPEGTFEATISQQLAKELSEFLRGTEVDPSSLGLPSEVENALILHIGEVQFEHVESVNRTTGNRLVCSARLLAKAHVVFYVFKADAYQLMEEGRLDLSEYDNDHYFEGEDDNAELEIQVRFLFDPATKQILTIDPPKHAYNIDVIG